MLNTIIGCILLLLKAIIGCIASPPCCKAIIDCILLHLVEKLSSVEFFSTLLKLSSLHSSPALLKSYHGGILLHLVEKLSSVVFFSTLLNSYHRLHSFHLLSSI
ncbi:hypothetical protein AVEN_165615-1 [Araneus ventricosus]|uniref:Secreted protein n=1 Tax=Araneus ventricosus TaxID=182803 RepID=A0A4Y2T6Z0_ARAVE|nr:hypothetical protein AVEN_165615-1 [Araneus ventricosus]